MSYLTWRAYLGVTRSLATRISRHRDRDHGPSGTLPRAPGTIVDVQLGEAITVAQDRPFVATISNRSRNATVRAMHAADYAWLGVGFPSCLAMCICVSSVCSAGELAGLIAECSGRVHV